MRVLPPLLYGTGHPYAIPFSGSGTEASVSALTRDDLIAFQRDFLRPDNATLIVTGGGDARDDPAAARAALRRLAATGQRPASPRRDAYRRRRRPATRVYLLDRPGAPQTSILAGQLMPSSFAPDRLELNTANDVLAARSRHEST